jgi:hypothetical protein
MDMATIMEAMEMKLRLDVLVGNLGDGLGSKSQRLNWFQILN